MTVFLNGTIVSRQLGTIIAPIFDAPYTLTRAFSYSGLGQTNSTPRSFAQGSMWPLLWNVTWDNTGAFFKLKKLNAAILTTTAPTLIATGFQNGIDGSSGGGNNENFYTPNYNGGVLGICYQPLPSKFTSAAIAAPLGVGSTAFPGQYFTTTSNSLIGNSQTFLVNYQGSTNFSLIYKNGTGSQFKFFIFNQNGAPVSEVLTTSGPFPMGGGLAATDYYAAVAPFNTTRFGGNSFAEIYNVMFITPTNIFRPTLLFLDRNLEAKFFRSIQLDNAAADAIMLSTTNNGHFYVQCTTSGFLFIVDAPYNINGFNQPISAFLISYDGNYWAPVILNMQGPEAINQRGLVSFGTTGITIDPLGKLWITGALSTNPLLTYVGGSFGSDLQLPIIPSFNNINLPPFELPCFIPCDIPISPK